MCGIDESVYIKDEIMQIRIKIILCLNGLFLFFMLFLPNVPFASEKNNQLVNCAIQNPACVQTISEAVIFFDIQPKPVKAMSDLTFEVKVKNVSVSKPPMIDLNMPGMKMGKNTVKMKMTAKGAYQGTGIIVRCPSGKTIWQATVDLPEIGSVNYIFNVVY